MFYLTASIPNEEKITYMYHERIKLPTEFWLHCPVRLIYTKQLLHFLKTTSWKFADAKSPCHVLSQALLYPCVAGQLAWLRVWTQSYEAERLTLGQASCCEVGRLHFSHGVGTLSFWRQISLLLSLCNDLGWLVVPTISMTFYFHPTASVLISAIYLRSTCNHVL